jgi:hypothetical protein
MSEPPSHRRSDPGPRLYRFEVRVRTNLAPALTSSFPNLVHGAVVPGHAVRRLALIRDEGAVVDLPAVLQRLTECDVVVLGVRLCRPSDRTSPVTGVQGAGRRWSSTWDDDGSVAARRRFRTTAQPSRRYQG